MTLVQLEYIVALDTYRHFVSAADSCFVTQPTLTMQVQKLEDEIGTLLFDRSKKPLMPTEMGMHFIARAREILREVNDLKEVVTADRFSIEGTFRIGIIPTLAPYLLPLFLQKFISENPNTKLIIEEIESLQMIQRIKEESLDLAIIVTPLLEKNIREIPLFNEPFLVYLPPLHSLIKQTKIDPQALGNEPVLVLSEGHCFRNQSLKICHQENMNMLHDTLKGFAYQSGSIETLKKMVDKGLGYTLVPELSVIDDLEKLNIKRFEGQEPVREVSLACHKNFSKERLLEKLRESILSVLPVHFTQDKAYVKVRWK